MDFISAQRTCHDEGGDLVKPPTEHHVSWAFVRSSLRQMFIFTSKISASGRHYYRYMFIRSIQILRSKPEKPSVLPEQCRIWLKLSVVSLGSFMYPASRLKELKEKVPILNL